MGKATAKLHILVCLFCLVEETERRLPSVRSLLLIKRGQILVLAKIYCLVSEKVVLKQYEILNGEPV